MQPRLELQTVGDQHTGVRKLSRFPRPRLEDVGIAVWPHEGEDLDMVTADPLGEVAEN